ncbi:pyridoxal phosphate-dependent aminotransferase [Limnochorda pilosa]|uniref:Aminotransferase n=1 Tax=Limnochorda pilosa TaxID=1555112 RepID=A0A0K2SGE1_LIMPI|nr:pyridoxal phosphate-dependent aminotransferase [Limnochorda pilosa]BAS26117.1 aspartate aminotransferase [Limnochorda pilosa]
MEIRPFLAMDVLERAQALERQGRSIVHLEVGEPGFDTPLAVREAARRALVEGETHYTHSLGLLELREAIAARYRDRYGAMVDPGCIVVTQGTSPALFLAVRALLEPGDAFLLPDPGYACYPNVVASAGGQVVSVPVHPGHGFRLRPEAVRGAAASARSQGLRPRALLINSPANPTGAVLSGPELEAVARAAAEEGLVPISDEIYHGLSYDLPDREHSLAEYTGAGFVVDGFSKRYAMTGWRLGYMVVPAEHLRTVQKLQQNLFICAGAFVQRAGLVALQEGNGPAETMRQEYSQRRRVMLDGLARLGLAPEVPPRGAFYVFADARHVDGDSLRLAYRLVEEAGVAVAPGIDFGTRGEGFLRLSYAAPVEAIKEGLDRLERFLAKAGALPG